MNSSACLKGDLVPFEIGADVVTPGIGLDIGAGIQNAPVCLSVGMIWMDEGLVGSIWRGAVHCQGHDWLPEMRKMEVLIR
jgi:hypothetical protein